MKRIVTRKYVEHVTMNIYAKDSQISAHLFDLSATRKAQKGKKFFVDLLMASIGHAIVLDLEYSWTSEFSLAFDGADIVYFSASAGENTSDERTKNIDFEGALKVFDVNDVIEGVKGSKPRLILVSTFDANDPDKFPAHYASLRLPIFFRVAPDWCTVHMQNEADIKASKQIRKVFRTYFHWKYEADKNLVQCDAFKWTIVRPGAFNKEPGMGKLSIGRTHITGSIAVSGHSGRFRLSFECSDYRVMMSPKSWHYCWIEKMLPGLPLTLLVETLRLKRGWML